MKTRLLFPGTAFAIGVIAFAVGYRTPRSLPAVPSKVEQAPEVAHVSTDRAPVVRTDSASQRDNLLVEGFAKVGFAEMEGLLTTASPQEREQWARELGALPNKPLKPIALVAFYAAWLDLEPEEALRSLQNFPDLLYRVTVFDSLGSAIPTTLLPQLLEVISEFSAAERRVLLPTFLAELAQTDPAATARFIDAHPKLVSRSDAAALMTAWARDDIDAARTWIEASPFLGEPEVLWSLVDSWFAKDPAAAQNYVLLHRDNEGIQEAVDSVASRLFSNSPEQAGAFIRAFDDRRASQILLSLVSSVDDDQVANLATWASTLPSSVAEGGLGYAFARWSHLDPKQALDWLRAKPAAERESLLVRLVRSQATPASPEIVSLAYQIRDVQKRDETLSILVQYLTAETGDATEQIRALGLSVSQTKHLLELRPVPRE
ncbi:MAG TPA: hypothetical protein VGW39_08990 [Chthoniobacterales bacterium]|nr:hypothetical protein [Chthoniobacterales bacterium]